MAINKILRLSHEKNHLNNVKYDYVLFLSSRDYKTKIYKTFQRLKEVFITFQNIQVVFFKTAQDTGHLTKIKDFKIQDVWAPC